jgi:hypothetical protein
MSNNGSIVWENTFNKDLLVRRFGEKVIQFPEHIDRIYSHKQELGDSPVLNSDEAMNFFRVLPLLITKNNLENILLMGTKDKLSKADCELIERNQKKVKLLDHFSYGIDKLPSCYLVNDSDLNGNKRFLRRVEELNWACEYWASISSSARSEIAVDMSLGGTHYLGINNNPKGNLNAYAKLTSLVDGNNSFLCIDSIESDNVSRQSIGQWKDDSMGPELFSLIEGALTVSRLFKYDGVMFRAPEAGQIAGFFGLPQRKFKDHRESQFPNYCKTGVKIKSKAKDLYRAPGVKDRFLSRSIFPFSSSALEEKVEAFSSRKRLNQIQGAYLETAQEILKRY